MLNKVTLIGNVGADPEVRTLDSGVKVARINLATTERIYNRTTQETKEHTEWHRITLWSGMAEVVDKYIRKGSQLYIEGNIRSREWTDDAGIKRYGVEIVANEMKMLGRRDANAAPSANYEQNRSTPTPAPVVAPKPKPEPVVMAEEPDDLPF